MPKFKIPYWYILLGPWLAMYLGAFTNQLAIAVNHGHMPVLYGSCDMLNALLDYTQDAVHTCMTHKDHLKFLCDWINLGNSVASPGDMLIWLGAMFTFPGLISWISLVLKDHNGS